MKYSKKEFDFYVVYQNENGAEIGMHSPRVIEQDGYIFKDLSGTGELLPYEDWRLDPETRAKDLAGRLSVEEIAGLMLYSSHQLVPFRSMGPFSGHYGGKEYEEEMIEKSTLTDEQKAFIREDHIRHILLMKVDNADTSAKWSNRLQALAEQEPWGIPVNISSDPRHGASGAGAEYKSAGVDVSKWPEGIGMTATFSEEHCRNYADAVSKEYRALGITTALGPQIDLATEPRWMRYEDTFGGDYKTTLKMTKLICDGYQTTEGSATGWGKDSIAAMAKHWPGGGTGEGGRDAHYPFGRYAVYPGENMKTHRNVFTEGALKLDGPTGQAASIMPYYTVSWGADEKNGEQVGNSYSEYLIKDVLRGEFGYDGILCTDWGITGDPDLKIDSFGARCYGTEDLTEAERHLKIIMNGIDQFGGNNDKRPILEAYLLGCERCGETAMRARMEESAVRLLRNMFRLGLFENPYLNPEESARIVGAETFVKNGMEAQHDSIVLLKNKNNVLPLKKGMKIYIPERKIRARKNFFRTMDPERTEDPVPLPADSYNMLFERVAEPEYADAAVVFIESPLSDAYSEKDVENGGNGYLPLMLQYRPYIAKAAREHSIAGGDLREKSADRTYRGKTNTAANESDLDLILDTKEKMKDKPVIVCVRIHNPLVVAEFETSADAITAEFGVSRQAVFDILFGEAEPKGKLPVILPADMETVERHNEDVFDDIIPYTDEEGHSYGFGYGIRYM